MTVFATPDAAVRLAFSDGVRREVVIEHEALGVLVEKPFDALDVFGGSERDRDERLGLAALEERGAVDARPHVDAAFDRADFLDAATVETRAGKDDVAHDAGRKVVERDFKIFGGEEVRLFGAFNRLDDERFAGAFLDGVARLSAGELAFRSLGGGEVVVEALHELFVHRRRVEGREGHLFRRDLFDEF